MITKEMVLKLREETGFGMLDCKKALEVSEYNHEKAVIYLKSKGLAVNLFDARLISYKRP